MRDAVFFMSFSRNHSLNATWQVNIHLLENENSEVQERQLTASGSESNVKVLPKQILHTKVKIHVIHSFIGQDVLQVDMT